MPSSKTLIFLPFSSLSLSRPLLYLFFFFFPLFFLSRNSLSFLMFLVYPCLHVCIDFQDMVVKLLNVTCDVFIHSCVISYVIPISFSCLFQVSTQFLTFAFFFSVHFSLFPPLTFMLSSFSLFVPSKFLDLFLDSYIFLCLTMYI